MQSIDAFLHVPDIMYYNDDIKGLAMFFNPTLETQKSWINLPLYYTGLVDSATVIYEENDTSPETHQINRDFSIDLLIGKLHILEFQKYLY